MPGKPYDRGPDWDRNNPYDEDWGLSGIAIALYVLWVIVLFT